MSILINGMDMPKDEELLSINIYPDGKVTINMDLKRKQVATAVSVEKINMKNDTISRQAAIANAISGRTREIDGEKWIRVSEVRESIKTLPSAQSEQRWIPCSKRLPDYEEKDYWVCDDEGYQYRCRWTNDRFDLGLRNSDSWGWYFRDVPQFSQIVAWMPLSEPWKGEENE